MSYVEKYSGMAQAAFPRGAESPSNYDHLNAQKIVQNSPFSEAEAAMEEARIFCCRVMSVVDRICGTVPVGVTGTMGKESYPMSVLASLREKTDLTMAQIREASEALSRLESELP